MPHCQLINLRLCVAFGTARYADSAVPVDASRPSWPRWLIGLCLILSPGVLPAEAHAAGQIEIEYADWGFDGRAVPRTFNLLTLGIQNLTAEPFEGTPFSSNYVILSFSKRHDANPRSNHFY